VFPYAKDKDMGTTCNISWNDWTPWATSYVFQYKKKVGSTGWINAGVYDPSTKIATVPGETYVCQVIVYKSFYVWGTTQLGEFTSDAYGSSVANATGTSLDLTWTNFNTGDPTPWVVDQYIRYRVKNSNSAWLQKYAAGGTNTTHLTGLTPGTDYEFLVNVYLPEFWGSTPLGYFNSGGVKELSSGTPNNNVTVYPNPFTNQVNIDLFTEKTTNVSWNIYDMTGKLVFNGSETISGGFNTKNISTEKLSDGVYMLNVILNDHMQSFRILKQ
jgi:hypothetical protein